MSDAPLVISLPIADRATAHDFYRRALGFEAVGPLADDGLPEPLQFSVRTGVNLMLVPTGGFARTIGDGTPAPPGYHECLLVVSGRDPADVDARFERAVSSGARVVAAAAQQPWGYCGCFADPDGHVWMIRAQDGEP